jgi:hypothetical protein
MEIIEGCAIGTQFAGDHVVPLCLDRVGNFSRGCYAGRWSDRQPVRCARHLDAELDCAGIVRLSGFRSKRDVQWGSESYRGGRALPLRSRLGSEDPESRPRDEVALKVEGVMDGSMHAQETLSGCG